jgi:hypothetical protein
MDKNKELQEIKASIETLDKKYRESKGYGEVSTKPCDSESSDMLYSMIQGVYRYIDYVQGNTYNWQDNHTSKSTHLPKLTASQTEKLLKSCGANEDFDVARPTIFARANRNGSTEFIAELKVPKKS